jgi:hypothetical protein
VTLLVRLLQLTGDMLALPVDQARGSVQYRHDATNSMHSISSVVSGYVWIGHMIEWTQEWKDTWITMFQVRVVTLVS